VVKSLWCGSLYELARDLQDYQKKGLRPLSLDGVEGRELQRFMVENAVATCLRDTRFTRDVLPQCEDSFRALVERDDERGRFVYLLLNEFASAIDADNIRRGSDKAHEYLTNSRDSWQMELPTANERDAVLYIHMVYCRELDASQYMSLDQMIGDFNRYLNDSAEWRQLRSRPTDRKGFDLIFVDEFHYFNKTEASIFHGLFNRHSDDEERLRPLFMAYDLKQCPTDAAFSTLFKATQTGQSSLYELTAIFRSQPAVSAFLSDLDGAFPAYGFAEWTAFPSVSPSIAVGREDTPLLQVFAGDEALIDAVFDAAVEDASRIGGREVAVLCLNDSLFSKYLKAGRKSIKGKFVPVISRDDIGELRYVRRKVVFSMPQYVAGLQFSNVYLIHVDENGMPSGASDGERRRFVTRCYAGASRAINRLHIMSSEQHGGYSRILNLPLARGSLTRV
jgi:hypothetical protein